VGETVNEVSDTFTGKHNRFKNHERKNMPLTRNSVTILYKSGWPFIDPNRLYPVASVCCHILVGCPVDYSLVVLSCTGQAFWVRDIVFAKSVMRQPSKESQMIMPYLLMTQFLVANRLVNNPREHKKIKKHISKRILWAITILTIYGRIIKFTSVTQDILTLDLKLSS